MTEPKKTQEAIEDNVNAAVDQMAETAQAAAEVGRQVTALWLGVSRTAIEAAAATLTTASEMVSSFADSIGDLSERIDDAAKKV